MREDLHPAIDEVSGGQAPHPEWDSSSTSTTRGRRDAAGKPSKARVGRPDLVGRGLGARREPRLQRVHSALMIAACHPPGRSSEVSASSGASWNFRRLRSLISDGAGRRRPSRRGGSQRGAGHRRSLRLSEMLGRRVAAEHRGSPGVLQSPQRRRRSVSPGSRSSCGNRWLAIDPASYCW
jgi:hypothetical protein